MPPYRRSALVLTILLATMATPAWAEIVPAARATDYVGREVTVEGRIVATYDSPLATVLAFAPNFSGFTATILAGDRAKFPSDVEGRYRGRMVQVTGTVNAYRGKPEMTVRDPSQLAIVVDPNLTPTPATTRSVPAAQVTPQAEIEELQRAVAALDDRLAALETRLAGAEQALASQAAAAQAAAAIVPTPASRVPGLGLGATGAAVRSALGRPDEVRRGVAGTEVWLYGTGRTVTFDGNGRVVGWTGF